MEQEPKVSERKERHNFIASQVVEHGSISVDKLVRSLGVSAMTVYRDLAALEEAGMLQRHRGRAVAIATGLHEAAAEYRVHQQVKEKKKIAAVAAQRVGAGSSVVLDDSTSSIWLLRALAPVSSLTVVTNSLAVAKEALEHDDWRLHMAGGDYYRWGDCFLGRSTLRTLAAIHADFCFISTSGTAKGKCFHPYEDVAEVKKLMVENSEYAGLLCDHTKFERHSLHEFAQISDFNSVYVDDEVNANQLQELNDHGVEVVICR